MSGRVQRPWRMILAVGAVMSLSGCGAWNTSFRPLPAIDRPATCQGVAGVPAGFGVEDIAPDPQSGGAYVSAADWPGLARYEAGNQEGSERPRRGKILWVTLNAEGRAVASDRTPAAPEALFPHGLDVWRPTEDGQPGRLFVVNHGTGSGPARIDIFVIGADGSLSLSPDSPGPITDLDRPNDVVGAGSRAFYASQDHASRRRSWFSPGAGELLEDIVGGRSAAVVFVDDNGVSHIASPASFPNGLELSSDGRRLFVSELTRAGVRVFDVDEPGRLSPRGWLSAPRMPDNLYLEDDRWLWIASHRSALSFARHARGWTTSAGPSTPSPGRLVRYDLDRPDLEPVIIQETTLGGFDARRAMSTVSAVAPLGGGYLMGSIFEGLLFCR